MIILLLMILFEKNWSNVKTSEHKSHQYLNIVRMFEHDLNISKIFECNSISSHDYLSVIYSY